MWNPREYKECPKITGLAGNAQIQTLICCNLAPALGITLHRAAGQQWAWDKIHPGPSGPYYPLRLRALPHLSTTSQPVPPHRFLIYHSTSNCLINNMLIKIWERCHYGIRGVFKETEWQPLSQPCSFIWVSWGGKVKVQNFENSQLLLKRTSNVAGRKMSRKPFDVSWIFPHSLFFLPLFSPSSSSSHCPGTLVSPRCFPLTINPEHSIETTALKSHFHLA